MEFTGPAIDEEEARLLAGFLSQPGWAYFAQYLERIKQEAVARMFNCIEMPPETRGYFKGLYKLSEDLQQLPEGLAKQLHARKAFEEDQEVEP